MNIFEFMTQHPFLTVVVVWLLSEWKPITIIREYKE